MFKKAYVRGIAKALMDCSAVKFANDLPKLNEVRQSLRARMNAPACQPANITRHLEAAYREMWVRWCRRT